MIPIIIHLGDQKNKQDDDLKKRNVKFLNDTFLILVFHSNLTF